MGYVSVSVQVSDTDTWLVCRIQVTQPKNCLSRNCPCGWQEIFQKIANVCFISKSKSIVQDRQENLNFIFYVFHR